MTTSTPTNPSTTTHSTISPYTSQPCTMGEFCWFECNSRNKNAAQKFYAQLIGATAQDCHAGPIPYTILNCGGHHALGLMEMDSKFPKDVPAHWMGYIAVENVDATTAKVTNLGGKVCVPPTDTSIGRFSVITDPTGAVFSLFQAHPGKTDGVNWFGPGFVGWNELMTSDPKTAVAFYTQLLGWKATESNTFGFPYWMFTTNGKNAGGMMTKCAEDKSPCSYWLQYIQTNDLDKSMALATKIGGTSLCDAMDVPGIGRTAYFTDPNGAAFALWQPAAKGGCCSPKTGSGCGCG